jgi:putative flippase GtrA
LRRLGSQLVRFGVVGAANTLVSLAVYRAVGSPALAFAAGAANGYVWNAAGYLVALPVATVATFAANCAWAFAPALS